MTKQPAPRSGSTSGYGASVSANVKAEAARRGMTAHDLLHRTGMPRSNWDRRMRNPQMWRLSELKTVARVLDVPLDRIVDEDVS